MTNRFDKKSYYHKMAVFELENPTNNTRFFINRLSSDLNSIWKDTLKYTKAGIMFYDLREYGAEPKDLFHDTRAQEKSSSLMSAFDSINKRYGEKTLYFSSQKTPKDAWTMKAGFKSPHYTTRFSDLPKVY